MDSPSPEAHQHHWMGRIIIPQKKQWALLPQNPISNPAYRTAAVQRLQRPFLWITQKRVISPFLLSLAEDTILNTLNCSLSPKLLFPPCGCCPPRLTQSAGLSPFLCCIPCSSSSWDPQCGCSGVLLHISNKTVFKLLLESVLKVTC